MPVDTKAPKAPQESFPTGKTNDSIIFGQPRRFIRSETVLRVAVVVSCALFACGCSKHAAANQPTGAAADTKQDQSSGSPPPYTPPVTPPPPVATSPDGGADLRQLNHIYIGWIVQNRRRPKNFDDFVASSGIQIPPAPSGKKYVIDKNGFIALASE